MHPNLINRIWARIKAPVDGWLLLFVVLLFAVSLIVLYSASNESMDRIANKAVFMLVALGLMWLVANIRPEILMQLALPGYLAGLVLLLGVCPDDRRCHCLREHEAQSLERLPHLALLSIFPQRLSQGRCSHAR